MRLRQHRPSWSWISCAPVCAFVLQMSVASQAKAEEDSATETAAARALAVDGLKLAQAGKCDEAIPKLERAEKLHHSAIVLSRLGECQVNAGNLVQGTEMLRKVLREPLPAAPSPALSKAYERAQTVLDAAKPRIAALTISIASAPTDLRLTVDGLVVANTLVDSELPADPGDHLIEAWAPGFSKASARVTLGAADKKTVTLKLEADPNAPAPTPASVSQDPGSTPAAPPQPGRGAPRIESKPAAPPEPANHTAAYVAWGVGVVGVGVGSVFGLMTLNKKHDLSDQCTSNTCPSSSKDAIDAAKLKGNISTIAFGVGGAALVLGTVLYFSAGSGSADAQASVPARGFAGLHNGRAMVGPTSVQLAADF